MSAGDFVDREGRPRRARALTVHQPWATLLAQRVKPVENRSWTPSPGDLEPGDFVLLHAGKTFDPEAWRGAARIAAAEGLHVDFLAAMERPLAQLASIANRKLLADAVRAAEAKARELVPFGAVVGVAQYAGAVVEGDAPARAAGGWFVGPFGWTVRDAFEIAPLPYAGAQGLFRLEAEALAEVRRRWHAEAFG